MFRFLNHIHLHHVLFIAFTLISIVPVLILSGWVQSSMIENEELAIEEKHLLLAQNITASLEQYAKDIRATIDVVEKHIEEKRPIELLENLFSSLHIDFVWLMDRQGRDVTPGFLDTKLHMSRIPDNIGITVLPSITASLANRDTTVFSTVEADTNNDSVIYAVKSIDAGRFLVAVINTGIFIKVQKAISFGDRGHAAIVDATGRTLAHPSEQWRSTRKNIIALPPVKFMTEGKTGVTRFYSPVMAADMVAGYAIVHDVGWGVMIPQPYDELLARANSGRYISMLIALFGVITAAMISWWLARIMCRPLVAVASSARHAASGNLITRIKSAYKYAPVELRELTDSFNHMVDEINQKNAVMSITTERLETAQRIAHLGNWEWDFVNNVFWCSDEVYRIYGFAAQSFEASFDRFFGMTHPDEQGYLKNLFDNARLREHSFNASFKIILEDDSIRYLHQEVQFHRAQGDKGMYLSAVVHEITEQKKYEEKLLRQANYDELTGLANRTLYFERLSSAIKMAKRRHEQVAVLFIDLDDFKTINDTYGHITGDGLLKKASARLSAAIRDTDTVARIGGDEFIIVMHEVKSSEDAAQVANKVLDSLSAVFILDSVRAFVSASIGISVYPNDADDVLSLHRNADVAMYQAKEKGKNNVQFFTSEMTSMLSERFQIAHDLRYALEENQFEVYFQPIVNIDGSLYSAEALIRWHHPEKGFISPEKFIPVAEEIGMINDIGLWVLNESCQQLKCWHDMGFEKLRVSVNVSPQQIKSSLTRDVLISVIHKAQIMASRLTLEITENIIMDDIDHAIIWMSEMREFGINISMDDFGTGYSSLSYLKRLPIDILKIDSSFISGISVNEDDNLMIAAIIAMAKGLGLSLVAEGVENEQQLSYLKQLHCDYIQGYLFSKPLPSKDFVNYLKQSV
ncbi:MAG: EAL domain-containing protein [Gammaproteobacteria bacterium]|nr:EAL domain-containing protein [Gammaproteobacteria bacterium]